MTLEGNFSNQFLIGLPGLCGDYFQNSISLLIEHNDNGAFGLVVNKPLDIGISELFPEFELAGVDCTVLEGGPVQRDKAFFLHNGTHEYESTYTVGDQIQLTTSTDLLLDLAAGKSPSKILSVLGYAGWAAGQLELELSENIWLLAPCSADILFDTPIEQKAIAAANALGVDLNLISPSPGHG